MNETGPRVSWRRTHPGLIAVLRAACLNQPGLTLAALDEGVVRWAVETGLGPLLARAIMHDPEAATSPLWPHVRGANLTARFVSDQQLGAMTDVVDACRGKVPPPVLLKGISVCEQYYPEPHLRPMRDIDFLVEEDALSPVEAILHRLGYRQWSTRPAAFYEGHHHSSPFVHLETGVWVDVHRAVFPAGREFASNRTFTRDILKTELRCSALQGRRVRRLSDELQIVHLACHWARGLRAVGGMVAMADIAYLLKTSPTVDWDRILKWTDGSSASRYLCLLLTYLQRHEIIDIPTEIIQCLDARQASAGHIALRIAHSLLDRYVADGQDFGMFMSERNFNRLWKLLVLQQRPSRSRGLRPWTVLRDPLTANREVPENGGPLSEAAGDEGETRTPKIAVRRGVMSMKGSGADAASFGTSSPAGAGAGRTDGASARTYPKRRSGLRVRAIDGEMVILDRQRQLVHQVNQTARFIWDRCDGQHALLHIAGDLAQVFDVDELTAQNDVAAVVRRLELVGLVDSVTGDGSSGERARRSGGGMNDV